METTNTFIPTGRIVYITYFRYGRAETQSIYGIYNCKESKKMIHDDIVSFLSYGPDDISVLHVLRLPVSVYNENINSINEIIQHGDDSDIDLLEILGPYELYFVSDALEPYETFQELLEDDEEGYSDCDEDYEKFLHDYVKENYV